MAAPIPLRGDYDGATLRRLAKASEDADQTRRLLALAVIYDGGRRGEAATLGGVGLQVVRDWVVRFNADGPSGLIDGKENKITRRWALRGTRPLAPKDQRTHSTYIFGAIRPAEGKAAGLVLPFCNTAAMNLHLAEISQAVAADAHAVLLMDQAGWHSSDKLDLPANISIVLLPAKSPELNPTENVWQFMRDNWLSNRVFKSADDIVVV